MIHKINDKHTFLQKNVLPRTGQKLNKRYTTVNRTRFIASISIYDNTQESAVFIETELHSKYTIIHESCHERICLLGMRKQKHRPAAQYRGADKRPCFTFGSIIVLLPKAQL